MSNPYFSVVTPVYRPEPGALSATIDSVVGQTFADWELILVDDHSDQEGVTEVLRRAAERDERIRLVEREANGGIVASSNDGIDAARGEFVVLLDHDDLLTPDALERNHAVISRHPNADYLYSDEDKVGEDGRHYDEFRKPPWSPERLRAQMYTSHLSVLRTALVREVGGFRDGFDGSQDHDLVLRVTERARHVEHVPQVLYHWRASAGSTAADLHAKSYADDARRRAVQEQLDRLGIDATAEIDPTTTFVRLRRSLDPETLVSVVIPTRGTAKQIWGEPRLLVLEAVRSVLERGGHDNLEFVVVYDLDTPDNVVEELQRLLGERLRLVPYDRPFNFSEKCNVGVLASQGTYVLLLNDDIEVRSEGFIPDLVAPLVESGVGLTGARLLFADSTIQHAGLGFHGQWPHHLSYGALEDDPGAYGLHRINREVSGVTGACVALRRETYDRVGGMTEALPVNFNDVDFSLKVRHLGLRVLWIATAEAFHFESQTRDNKVQDWEKEILRSRWWMPRTDEFVPDFTPQPR
ncbi:MULTISPECIES: glycosyltransferase family 2 protein [unclassified Nocardioides]|uniref:glycosyltransferase family 2 protein n=1 Tax=unclassified Nocardioides TaxID=2615069 RepID=UPI003610C462